MGNHETTRLDSVLQSPFETSNTSTNLATISFGGTLDAGTTVEVIPEITEGDQLRLDYSISLSTFVGEASDPTLPPPRQQNRLHVFSDARDSMETSWSCWDGARSQ